MLCPECNRNLLPISLHGQNGQVILDYCHNCGGVWSDKGEVNFIKSQDLKPLLNMLPPNPADTYAEYQSLLCPLDHGHLQPFRSESVPLNITLMKCDNCSGVWFPKKCLPDFKKAQEAKLNYFKTWQIPLPSIYSVLLPLLLFVFLGVGLAVTIYNVGQNTDVRIKAENKISDPLVLYPKTAAVLISFHTQQAGLSKLKYWINPDEITETLVTTTPKTTHTIILENLEANKKYNYQLLITEPEQYSSPIYSFTVKEN